MEIWKYIDGYDDYQVSNCGRVKSLKYGKEKILKTYVTKIGYLYVILCKNGKSKHHLLHRLVAQAFLDNPYNLPEVNHKNEDKTDNRVENLEFCDHKYNMHYGTGRQRFSIKHKNGKLAKTVYQYTLDGVFVAEYPSTMEVQRQLGFKQPSISYCCNGKLKTAYGYKWRYKK